MNRAEIYEIRSEAIKDDNLPQAGRMIIVELLLDIRDLLTKP